MIQKILHRPKLLLHAKHGQLLRSIATMIADRAVLSLYWLPPIGTCVEIRPLFSQTCTARIQKFPDGSGSPQMFPDVSRCF
eukprot:jgi/Chrzof1/6265/UNPLg00843.t1